MANTPASWVPPVLRARLQTLGLSLKRFCLQAGIPPTTVHSLYTEQNNRSIKTVVKILKELGYPCTSPEFDILNELIASGPFTESTESRTLNGACNEHGSLVHAA